MNGSRKPHGPLRQVVRRQGRSLNWLARETGVDQSMLWRLDQGQRRPSAALAARISATLGVPIALLFPVPPK